MECVFLFKAGQCSFTGPSGNRANPYLWVGESIMRDTRDQSKKMTTS